MGIAHDRWFFYSKIGAAFDHNDYKQNATGVLFPNFPTSTGPFVVAGSASDNRAGWTVGTGLEWAFFGDLSAKVEYNYMNFGSRTITFNDTEFAALVNASPRLSMHCTSKREHLPADFGRKVWYQLPVLAIDLITTTYLTARFARLIKTQRA